MARKPRAIPAPNSSVDVAEAVRMRRGGAPYPAIADKLGASVEEIRAAIADAYVASPIGDAPEARHLVEADQAELMRGAAMSVAMQGDPAGVATWLRLVEWQSAQAAAPKAAGEIGTAAASGDRRAALIAVRDRLAAAMDQAPVTVVAQIAGRFGAVLAEIETLSKATEVDALDDLRARRAARLAATPRTARSRRQVQ